MAYKLISQFNNNSKLAFTFRLLISTGVIGGIGYGALSYYGFLNANQPAVERKSSKEQAATVDALVVAFEDVQPIISNFGQIVTAKQLPLSASVGGRIKYISANFKNGAIVKQGELLLEIDDFQYQGNLLTSKANLQDISFKAVDIDNQIAATQVAFNSNSTLYENAKSDYAGSINLQKSGVITKQALDTKNKALIQQKQSLDTASASLENLKNQKLQLLASVDVQQWAVDKANQDLQSTKIYAPFSAYIHNANLEVGQFINANSAIATLLDQQKIDVKFTLSDGQYGRIIAQEGTIIGRKVQAIWQVGQVQKTFDAQINRVNSEIVAASGGIDLYASIINVEAVEALRIGAFVKVLIPDQTYLDVIQIPEHMIYDNDTVYVVARNSVEEQVEENVVVDLAEDEIQAEKTISTEEAKPTEKAAQPNKAEADGQGQFQGQRKQGQEQAQGARQGQRKGQNASTQNADEQQNTTDTQPQGQAQRQGQAQQQGQDSANEKTETLDENQKRLEAVKVSIVGYTAGHVLIVNNPDTPKPLNEGDSLLQTRLTLAGKGVLVITTAESEARQKAALEKLKARNEAGGGQGNRRFGGRGPQNIFGGSGGGGRRR